MAGKTQKSEDIQGFLAVEAMRNPFSYFIDGLRDKVTEVIATQIDNPAVYTDFDYLPKFCTEILDTSYPAGMSILYDEYLRIEKSKSVSACLGDFILANIDGLTETDEDKAWQIRLKIAKDLSHYDDDILLPHIRNNIHQITVMRADQGWPQERLDNLRLYLTEPSPYDSPRRAAVKKEMRNDFFPSPETDDKRPKSYHPYKDAGMFYYEINEDIDDTDTTGDIRRLPITSLFYDTMDRVLFDINGRQRNDAELSDFICLSKAMHAMADIDSAFTLEFFTTYLITKHNPKDPHVVTDIITDFIHQQAVILHDTDEINDYFYNHVMEKVELYRNTDKTTQRNIALTNLHGIIAYKREQNDVLSFVKEQGKYLTAYKDDTDAQISAKTFIAENLINFIALKP